MFLKYSHLTTSSGDPPIMSTLQSHPLLCSHLRDWEVIFHHWNLKLFAPAVPSLLSVAVNTVLRWRFCSGAAPCHQVNVETGSEDGKLQVSVRCHSQFFFQLAHGHGPDNKRSHSFVQRGEGDLYSGIDQRNFIYMLVLLKKILSHFPSPDLTHQIQLPKDCFGGRNSSTILMR